MLFSLPKPSNIATRYSGMRTTVSLFGVPLPIIFGQQRVAGKLLWYGDFTSSVANQGKKGKGGGSGIGGKKSSNVAYVYAASVILAIAQGNCNNLLSVWDSTGKFVVSSVTENFTVPPGGGSYTVAQAANYAQDNGVAYPSSYSVPANDFGSPGPVTLSGTQNVPFTPVVGSPGTGQYSLNTSTGTYTFAAGDAGKQLIVVYSFYEYVIISNELDVIPITGPYKVTVEHQPYFHNDTGVKYYPSGAPLTLKTGAPNPGTYDPNGGNYLFNSADAGKAVNISYEWDEVQTDQNAPTKLNITFLSGALGQPAWSYMTSKHPGQALGYNELCYVASSGLYLGYSPVLPNFNYEILGLHPFGGGITDANPADCIQDVLSDPSFGVGFTSDFISPTLQGVARSYWTANSFFISAVLDKQQPVSNVIGEWLEASQVGTFWSEGLLKFIPYGDTTTVGNGAVYSPPTQPVVSLNDGDFLTTSKNEDPVKHTRIPWQDAKNKVGVRWCVRTNEYNEDVIYAEDDAAIDATRLRLETPVDYAFICTLTAAQLAANLRVQRYSTIRNNYSFTLRSSYAYLEPMDIVQITDTRLGLTNAPVRIKSIEDDPVKGLAVVVEDFPWSISSAVLYPKQGQLPPNLAFGRMDPGNTDLFVIEGPSSFAKQSGNSIFIFTNGQMSTWGGCNLYASYDNVEWQFLATLNGPGRFGALTSPLPFAPDPDYTDTLSVAMENSGAGLLGVQQQNADIGVTVSALTTPAITTPTFFQNLAGTGANLPGGAWNNPRALSPNYHGFGYADVSLVGGGAGSSVASGWAAASQFGFNLLEGSPLVYPLVLGFQIYYEAEAVSLPSDGGVASVNVQLVDHTGSRHGAVKLKTVLTQPSGSPLTDQWQGYTVSGAYQQGTEWGTNLTGAQVSNPNFGVAFQGVLTNTGATVDIRVRKVSMTVFTNPGNAVELITYQNAVLTGQNQYGLTYLRRGQFGTVPAAWPTGTLFARLDDASYVYKYPSSFIGRTIYLKALSFNLMGNGQQGLADVEPLAVPLTGVVGSFDLFTGAPLTPAGGTVPSLVGTMSYVSTTTTITWVWNLVVTRNDGSMQTFQGSQTITGLTLNTNYYFYPYIDDSNGVGNAFVTFVSGINGVGDPPIAQTITSNAAAAIQIGLNHIPCSSQANPAATTASGSGGGNGFGGGGGGNNCFTGNVRFRTPDGFMRFDEAPRDRLFKIVNECGIFSARLLVHDGRRPMIEMRDPDWEDESASQTEGRARAEGAAHVPGKGSVGDKGHHLVTLAHQFKEGHYWRRADSIFAGNPVIEFSGEVYNLEVITDREEAHHYVLENGRVAHNYRK